MKKSVVGRHEREQVALFALVFGDTDGNTDDDTDNNEEDEEEEEAVPTLATRGTSMLDSFLRLLQTSSSMSQLIRKICTGRGLPS